MSSGGNVSAPFAKERKCGAKERGLLVQHHCSLPVRKMVSAQDEWDLDYWCLLRARGSNPCRSSLCLFTEPPFFFS